MLAAGLENGILVQVAKLMEELLVEWMGALLYTFENGFMPDQTWKNMANTAKRMDLDQVVVSLSCF